MSRRLIIASLVCAAVGFGFWWLVQNSEWIETKVPGMLSGRAVQEPFYAASRLVEQLGGKSQRLLSLLSLPPRGSVLVITEWNWAQPERRDKLQQWVADGGRLVIDDSLSTMTMAPLQMWTHMGLTYPFQRGKEENPLNERIAEALKPCRELHAVSSGPPANEPPPPWQLCGLNSMRRLVAPRGSASWGVADEFGLLAVRMPIGKGTVFYNEGQPFKYHNLIDEDNARLFVAATQLRRGDFVFFLDALAPESLFQLIWREASSAVCLLLLAIAVYIWRSGMRVEPLLPSPEPVRRSLVEQIRGTTQFLRYGGDASLLHAATLAALESAGQRKLAGYSRLPAEARLELIAVHTGLDIERLRSARSWRDSRGSDGLTESIFLLEAARRRLLLGAPA